MRYGSNGDPGIAASLLEVISYAAATGASVHVVHLGASSTLKFDMAIKIVERARKNDELVPAVARIVRRPTLGFGHLEEAGRPDLMVETLVLDTKKPYHRFFTAKTIAAARERMKKHGYLDER